jgi:leucyl aminopeptidase (aminopeptidase T)
MPGITKDMFLRAIPVDYQKMNETNEKLRDLLLNCKEIRITTKLGTDIAMEIMPGRKVCNDNGITRDPGTLNNLPAGEVAISPKEGSTNGAVFFDLPSSFRKDRKPFMVKIRDGNAVESDNRQLWNTISGVENGTNVAELGIGTNPSAMPTGKTLEDEKIMGTAHIAFGTSAALGGTIQTSIHLDFVFNNPTIGLDGKVIMKEGEFLF